MGVVPDAVEHGQGKSGVTSEGPVPLAEREVRGEEHRAFLVTVGNDLEEQVRLVTGK